METCRRRNVMFYLVTFYYEMLIFRYQNRKSLTIICNTRGMFPEPFSLAGLCLSVFFRFPQATMRIKHISYLASFNRKIAIVRSTKDGRLRDFRATRKYKSVFQSVLVI